MYRDREALENGYERWLWSAYGSAVGSAAVVGASALAYLVPPAAAIAGTGQVRRLGLLGYGLAVAARLSARSIDSGATPTADDVIDAFAHPASVLAYARLVALSHRSHRRGTTTWKRRPV
ncbi:hypothetical protein [Antrihabitans cavernicola]|uniref:hypothetical protein n=1 Tax=Antrihabitans cavernicola TaxID=2495913 RepID=UPI001F3332C8|nr:hypothetical protein [Spelaeibacter cavernicola]